MTNVFNILEERGYIEQMTHPSEIKELFGKESVPFYIGIDPTADSLHVGHFVSLMVASHMQKCGHKPIILVGGGTASIGDPSGKTDMRKMLSREDVNHNVECLKKQIEKFVSFEGENAAIKRGVFNNREIIVLTQIAQAAARHDPRCQIHRFCAADLRGNGNVLVS